MSVSYVVDFTALLLLGPKQTGLCGGGERHRAIHAERPQRQSVLPHPLQHRSDRPDD
jgi:hypothetical protein